MKYYIISGEASGDLHGSNLIKAIKVKDKNAKFKAWGGELMQKQGAEIVKNYKDLAFMGFAEVLMNLRTIFKNIAFCKRDLLKYKPDVLILIDYPGFNLRIAEFAKNKGIKVVYYISPQVWAWKKTRVHKIKKYVDKMLVILPFEKDFYDKYNYDVEFVGHPLLDAIENKKFATKSEFISRNKLNEKLVVALLPGSRKQEVASMLNVMLSIEEKFPDYQFVIAGVESLGEEFYKPFKDKSEAKVIFGQTHSLVANAYAALVTSGTATLETAIIGTPQIVCYRGNWISVEIAKRIVDIKYISLVNLIMDKEVVCELIQSDLNSKRLTKELNLLLDNKTRERINADYKSLIEKLGNKGASERAAEAIVTMID